MPPQELEASLDQMQLVVLAVTSKFLYTDHRAKDVELKYALRQHIPVLPILLCAGHGAHLTGESPVAGIYRQA